METKGFKFNFMVALALASAIMSKLQDISKDGKITVGELIQVLDAVAGVLEIKDKVVIELKSE